MSLKEDFQNSKLSDTIYLHNFWEATNLKGKGCFDNVSDFSNVDEISEAAIAYIDGESNKGMSEVVKKFCRENTILFRDKIDIFLEENNGLFNGDYEKRMSNIEEYCTRVIRGDFLLNNLYILISDANYMLNTETVRPFERALNELFDRYDKQQSMCIQINDREPY